MYETLRIVEKTKPHYVIWENVKNVISKKHRHNFDAYLDKMNELGYNSTWSVLSAKDFGIPQSRERVFVISILGNQDFNMPTPMELKLTLQDLLENEVEYKYFLSDKMVRCMMGIDQPKDSKYNRNKVFLSGLNRKNQHIARTITTRAGSRPTDNFIKETLKSKLCDKLLDNNIVEKGDVINHSYTNSVQRLELKDYIESKTGIMPTLTTRPDILGVAVVNNEKLLLRKLTPKECWRLMGFDDNVFEKAQKVNSNAQLYKQAGNSIVVDILQALLTNLLLK